MPKRYFLPFIDNGLGLIQKRHMLSMVLATNYLTRKYPDFEFVVADVSVGDLCHQMNAASNAFVETDCHRMIVIDGDETFLPWHLEALISHDVPIVFGGYCKKKRGMESVIQFLDAEKAFANKDGHLVEAYRGARGFMNVHREVFEALKPSCPTYINPATDVVEVAYWTKPPGYCTEDYPFCDRVRELGFKIMVDSRISVNHIGWADYPMADELEGLKNGHLGN